MCAAFQLLLFNEGGVIIGGHFQRPCVRALMRVVRAGAKRVQHVHSVVARVLIQQTLLLLVALLPQEGIDAKAAAFFGPAQLANLVTLLHTLIRAIDHRARGT